MSMYTHVELHSQDPAAAKAFYSGVFGWTYSEMPMPGGSYTMVANAKGESLGGIVPAQNESAPESFIGYITVASAKASLARAVELGATIVVGFTEIPGMGAFAILADPRGAVFGLWEEAPSAKPPEKKVAKKAAKKAAKKKVAKKKVAKKAAKKAAKKKVAKKAAKKKVAKKAAKKKVAKKAAKKKVAKKAAKKK